MDRVAQSQPVSAPERAVGEAQSSALFWTPERQAALVAMAREGLTGSEIASALGTTRSAVLGRCHRTGVVLPMDQRKAAMKTRKSGPRSDRAAPRRGMSENHPARRSRPKGARAFSDVQIAAAIAARLAGASWRGAAETIGASAQSLNKNWWRNPQLLAQGQALYERAREIAVRDSAARRKLALLTAESERLRVARTNAPLFAQMLPKHRRICERAVAGDPLSEVGRDEGLTRERIRQIVSRWRAAGLIVPEARALSETCRHSYRPYVGVEVVA